MQKTKKVGCENGASLKRSVATKRLVSTLSRLAILTLVMLCSHSARSMIVIDDFGRIVDVDPSFAFLDFYLEPPVIHISHLAIILDEDYISDAVRQQARNMVERFDAIAAQPFRYDAPNQIVVPYVAGVPKVVYLPNGSTSINVLIPPRPGAVKYQVINDLSGAIVWNSSSSGTAPISLTHTGTLPGVNYDAADGRNPFTVRFCFNSACTSYNHNDLEITVDSVNAPLLRVASGQFAIVEPSASGPCTFPGTSRVEGQNGDVLCVQLASPEEDPAGYQDGGIFVRFNPEGGFWNAKVPSLNDFLQDMLPGVFDSLCDDYEAECNSVVVATIWAVGNSVRCDGYVPDYDSGMSDAVRHLTWAYSIAWRFRHERGYSVPQAVNRARVWLEKKETEAQQTGCNNPAPGSNEEMDCNNNEIGLDLFVSNPNLAVVQIGYATYEEAHDNPNVIVKNGPRSCPIFAFPG